MQTRRVVREGKCVRTQKKYQLVTEKNIADIVVICANMPEDIKVLLYEVWRT